MGKWYFIPIFFKQTLFNLTTIMHEEFSATFILFSSLSQRKYLKLNLNRLH